MSKREKSQTLLVQLVISHLTAGLGAVTVGGALSYLAGQAPGILPTFMTVVVVVILALALSVLKARSVARPVNRLTQEIEGVASDNAAFTPEFLVEGSSQIQALAQALSGLTRRFQDRHTELVSDADLKGQILDSMPVGVVLVEVSGSVAFINPSAHALLGSPTLLPARVIETPHLDFEVHHPQHKDLSSSVVSLGEQRRLVLVQDITERKRIDSVRRDFVSNASHELKTPVGGILALSETLEQAIGDDPVAANRFVVTLVAQARRLAALVQDLLDLTRLETTAKSTRQVDLVALVRAEVERITPTAQAKNLAITGTLQDAVFVNGEPADLRLAVRNLLDNAVRYTFEGEIKIDLRSEAAGVVFEVTDTGIGIPSKDLARIFERFYRVDQARSRDTGGTGLGLSIVRHVAERHGGEILAESDLGNGSRFIMRLP